VRDRLRLLPWERCCTDRLSWPPFPLNLHGELATEAPPDFLDWPLTPTRAAGRPSGHSAATTGGAQSFPHARLPSQECREGGSCVFGGDQSS
jgi:hypothetical protein